jgi:uncharacterized protein (TIGR03435 family)
MALQTGVPLNFGPSPNGFRSQLSLWQAIMLAYSSPNYMEWPGVEMRNAPPWIGTFYEFSGRVAPADVAEWQNQGSSHDLLRSALRAALEERCKLILHTQPSKRQIWELVVNKTGPHLRQSDMNGPPPDGGKLPSGAFRAVKQVNGKQVFTFYRATMQDLADYLSIVSKGIPVRDKTGLAGHYDFPLRQVELFEGDDPIQRYPVNDLGLSVKRGLESSAALVIDHIEKPTPN